MSSDRERGGMLPGTAAKQPVRRDAFSAAPAPGEIIATKYRVERVLGAGGMGVVVAAHHLHLETKVAIKFLLPGTLKDSDTVARFAREARAAAKITNEHVARVLDVGTLETGAPYIVMEFLEGADLATHLRSQGSLPVDEAVEFVLQACEALAEAHSIGIVHRDLKPANLFCIRRPDGLPWIKVLDFGISKLLRTDAMSPPTGMTQSATIMGSPLYMSPEQMQSARDVDTRTDIWALGVVLYELLAGCPPFQGDSLPEVIVNIATRPVPRLRALRPDCPAEVDQAVMKCLEKDRNARFDDVAGLAVALLPFAPERARASVERITRTAQRDVRSDATAAPGPSSPFFGSSPAGPAETLPALGHTASAPRGRRGAFAALWALAGGAVVLALGLVVVSVAKKEPAAPVPSTTPAAQVSSLAPAATMSATIPAAPPPPEEAAPAPVTPSASASVSAAPSAPPPPPATPPSPAPVLPKPKPVKPVPTKQSPPASAQPSAQHEHDLY